MFCLRNWSEGIPRFFVNISSTGILTWMTAPRKRNGRGYLHPPLQGRSRGAAFGRFGRCQLYLNFSLDGTSKRVCKWTESWKVMKDNCMKIVLWLSREAPCYPECFMTGGSHSFLCSAAEVWCSVPVAWRILGPVFHEIHLMKSSFSWNCMAGGMPQRVFSSLLSSGSSV